MSLKHGTWHYRKIRVGMFAAVHTVPRPNATQPVGTPDWLIFKKIPCCTVWWLPALSVLTHWRHLSNPVWVGSSQFLPLLSSGYQRPTIFLHAAQWSIIIAGVTTPLISIIFWHQKNQKGNKLKYIYAKARSSVQTYCGSKETYFLRIKELVRQQENLGASLFNALRS
jgi:hypothetical protein